MENKNYKKNMEVITVYLPLKDVEYIDNMKRNNLIISRSEFIRQTIKMGIEKSAKIITCTKKVELFLKHIKEFSEFEIHEENRL